MKKLLAGGVAGLLVVWCVGSAADPPGPPPSPLVPAAKAEVQPLIAKHLAPAEATALQQLRGGDQYPALFRTPVRTKALADPWGGMADLEKSGLDLASASRGGLTKLPALLDGM